MILVYKQIWKPIVGFPGYQISNYGQVKSWYKKENNEDDKKKHGTVLFGEKNHSAKLKDLEVIEIRRLWNISRTCKKRFLACKKIGKMFKVSRSCVHRIATGITWIHV